MPYHIITSESHEHDAAADKPVSAKTTIASNSSIGFDADTAIARMNPRDSVYTVTPRGEWAYRLMRIIYLN
jgi:hypothetical protein